MRLPVLLAAAAAFVPSLLAGCATPARRHDEVARELSLQRTVTQGEPFAHVIYRNATRSGPILHIYIDGDGTPMAGSVPAADPTPRQPLMLRLMAMDASPAVYFGRPCYHGLAAQSPCTPRLWTTDRYSRSVVDSLAEVARQMLRHGGYQGIAWIGYSGGGTLAVLLAARFSQTVAVVTIAANLDTGLWADFARQDLGGSLNPAWSVPAFPSPIFQRHYAGSDDRIVPPSLVSKAAAGLGQPLTIVPGFRHGCCWERIWSQVLDSLRRAEEGSSGKTGTR